MVIVIEIDNHPKNKWNKRPFLYNSKVPKGHRVVNYRGRWPEMGGFGVLKTGSTSLIMTYFEQFIGWRPKKKRRFES